MSKQNQHTADDTFLARWLAGELSDEELMQFQASDEYKEYVEITKVADSFSLPEYNVEEELSRFKKTIDHTKQVNAPVYQLNRTHFISIAAAILIAVFTGIYYFYLGGPDMITFETAYGETQSLTLPDGSTVILNASSSLSYSEEEWESNRSLNLQGEAYFKVTTGNKFTVQTDLGSVSVLGTEFNVKSRKNVFNAACFEGSISVTSSEITKLLEPGQNIQFEDGEIISEDTFQNVDQPSWMTGVVTLTNVPLLFALDELTSQFGIQISGNIPVEARFTGSFPTNNASSAVQLILEPFDLQYQFDSVSKLLTIE
ncbi:MAG: FecR domain-containing protein [Balneolaceae bacterium]